MQGAGRQAKPRGPPSRCHGDHPTSASCPRAQQFCSGQPHFEERNFPLRTQKTSTRAHWGPLSNLFHHLMHPSRLPGPSGVSFAPGKPPYRKCSSATLIPGADPPRPLARYYPCREVSAVTRSSQHHLLASFAAAVAGTEANLTEAFGGRKGRDTDLGLVSLYK